MKCPKKQVLKTYNFGLRLACELVVVDWKTAKDVKSTKNWVGGIEKEELVDSGFQNLFLSFVTKLVSHKYDINPKHSELHRCLLFLSFSKKLIKLKRLATFVMVTFSQREAFTLISY